MNDINDLTQILLGVAACITALGLAVMMVIDAYKGKFK